MKVYSPWTEKEVNHLKKRQKVRPYRCEFCNEVLIPTEFGFICSNPDCDFMQNWVLSSDLEEVKDGKQNENSDNRRFT
jgi:hypothetical protein